MIPAGCKKIMVFINFKFLVKYVEEDVYINGRKDTTTVKSNTCHTYHKDTMRISENVFDILLKETPICLYSSMMDSRKEEGTFVQSKEEKFFNTRFKSTVSVIERSVLNNPTGNKNVINVYWKMVFCVRQDYELTQDDIEALIHDYCPETYFPSYKWIPMNYKYSCDYFTTNHYMQVKSFPYEIKFFVYEFV